MKDGEKKRFVVTNVEQAALMLEIDGQLSDGFWENTRPTGHWRPWCEAVVVVAKDGEPIGRNFQVQKDTYGLANKDLLDVVKPRMIAIVRIARKLGLEVAILLEHQPTCEDGSIDWEASFRYVEKLKALAVTPDEVDTALRDQSYGDRQLKKDLWALQKTMKIFNG